MLIILYIIISIIIYSLAEYVVHRYLMHQRRKPSVQKTRHALHHFKYYKEFAGDPDPAAPHISIELGGPTILYYSMPLLLILFALGYNVQGFILGITGVIYGEFWSFVHLKMHEPSNHWFVSTRYFKAMETHHRLHHENPSTNFGAVFLGFWDIVLGTKYAR